MAKNPKSLANLTPFQPGQCGNPNGGPKGKRIRTVIKEMMEMPAIILSDDPDQSTLEVLERKLGRPLTNRDVVVYKQMVMARDRTAAARALWDREEGRPRPEAEDSGMPETDALARPLTPEEMKELVKVARGEK